MSIIYYIILYKFITWDIFLLLKQIYYFNKVFFLIIWQIFNESMLQLICYNNSFVVSEQHLQSYDNLLTSFVVHEQYSQSYDSLFIKEFWNYNNSFDNYQAISMLILFFFILTLSVSVRKLNNKYLLYSYLLSHIYYIFRWKKNK